MKRGVLGLPFLNARSERAADKFCDEAVPGLSKVPGGDFMLPKVEARERC